MIVVRHARESDAAGILECLHAAFEPGELGKKDEVD